MPSEANRGRFIAFEGGDGSGKTTQSQLLALHLKGGGWNLLHLREPGGTQLGEEVRRLLLYRDTPLSAEAELLLFLAARAELVRSVIEPALHEGAIVICDRFSGSTLAYQGYARGLDLESVRTLDAYATGGLQPDLVILCDLPVAVARQRNREDDAFWRLDDAFHERVRQGYLALARDDPARWVVLDATKSEEELAREVIERVETAFRPPRP